MPPPDQAFDMADGFDTRYLLSFGPFDIDPGQTLPMSFAFVGGENVHAEPHGIEVLDPLNPQAYHDLLDFSNFALNARWASWIYDNPGVDSDGDGFRGKFRICGTDDTLWYEGDGVPDFKGASPPQAPRLRIIPSDGKLIVRWNGFYTETTKDAFLDELDFEGYRVHIGRDERLSSFTLLASYDKENFNRFRWKTDDSGSSEWALETIPFTLDSLRVWTGNPSFEPLNHDRTNPYLQGGEIYYFARQDFNQSDLSDPRGIHKVYPNESDPGKDSTLWQPDDVITDYGEPLPKYYEYEYVIEDLLPSVPYYVSVTTFDFGSPKVGLPSLETNPTSFFIAEFPQTPADTVEALGLDAYVYPNPYRLDGGYIDAGFENRRGNQAEERARRIHFANLPKVCTIRIYSMDGDLVREIPHNYPEGGPQSMHETWDLITRNTQAVVSGLYYYTIESETRTQVGKLAIIK